MRTAIFFGMVIIANSINPETTQNGTNLICLFIIVFIVADVVSFLVKNKFIKP